MGHQSGAYRNKDGPPGVGPAIAALAARQHGLVFVEQLRALGLDRYAVARRVAAGLLHPIHRGVYAVGHPRLSTKGRFLAAVVACGPNAALSHRAAAYMWDLRGAPARIEVTAPRGRRGPTGITVHRSRILEPSDVTTVDGIRVTTVARTLLDLAAAFQRRDLARVIDRAERAELLDMNDIDKALARARGRRGAKALRAALAAWQPSYTREELEARFQELVVENNLPRPQHNVVVTGERQTYEVDALWPAKKLIVELDGFAFHRTRRDLERDAAKTADLELAGYRVVHLTWDEVTVNRARTVRRLRILVS